MTDVSPQEFLDILKDPTLSNAKRKMKQRVLGFIHNPKTEIKEVSVTDFKDGYVTTTIKIRTYD